MRTWLGTAAALGALAIPVACGGSTLDPAQVRAANNAVAGQAGGTGSGGTVGTSGDTGGTTGTTGTTGTGGSGGSTGGTTGGTGAGGTGGSTGGSTGTTGGGSGGTTGGKASAGGDVQAGSCAGFKNQTGINDKTITIGNSSDISGPVPGLFTSAQQATKAYVAYFNATSSICGRKLQLNFYDSRTDAGADQQSYVKMCSDVFAGVGSMSAFDSGGAATADKCGLPDLRSASVPRERNACGTCYGVQATDADEFENAVPDFFLKNYRDASQHAAFLYLNAGAAAQNAKTQQAVETKRGMKFLYSAGIGVSEFNYGSYVQAMKDKGVKWVQFLGSYQAAVRLAQTMQQAAFKPEIYLGDPTIYNQDFIRTGGSAVEGAVAFVDFTPFEEAGGNKEMALYRQWLAQVAPGAEPTFFGLFSWSAAKLFVQQALKLGGKLTRSSLASSIRSVSNWTADGLHAAQPVGAKHNASCWRFLQVKNGKWVPFHGRSYVCHGFSRG
jgi:ABC-type branched-subunit amino acid transport system substrate-binding protein